MIELYHTVATDWHPIGTFLGISQGKLKIIAEHEHDPQKCLMEMISVWLCQTNPPASWPDIAKAVEFIGRPDVAQQIRQKYCKCSVASYLLTLWIQASRSEIEVVICSESCFWTD